MAYDTRPLDTYLVKRKMLADVNDEHIDEVRARLG